MTKITKLYPVLIVLLAALLVLAACGATDTPAPAPTAEPTPVPPTEEPAAEPPEAGALTANPWQWTSFTGPMEQFDVEMPESYLLAFSDDGEVNIVADCNNAMGSYTDDAGSLTIEVGPATPELCLGDSRDEQFITLLGSVVRYYFEDGTLYIDLEADGGTMAFAPADAELMAAEAPEAGALAANPWQWVSFTGPMEQFDVEMPESYLVAFNGDGSMNIVADCNNAMGNYTDDAGSLTIEVGGMTRVACPPESRSDQFVLLLGSAVRYYFEDGTLYIDLEADGGTMAFASADAELMASAGEGALTANPWQWTSFTGPMEQFDVEMPGSYLLTFNQDGTVNIVADCNNALGGYTDDAGSLTIEVGPATLALCPGDSRGEQFVTLLGSAVRYYIVDGMLYIDLEADGGTMAFLPYSAEQSAGDVTSYPWLWSSFTSPMEQFDVEAPENYVVTFNDDGTVNIKADCNNASGSYTVDAGSLTIEVGPMTMAACPPDSRSDQFVALLGSAVRYFFEDAQLYIDLLADGGTMVFAPEGEAEMGGTGQLPAELVAQLDAYLQSQVWSEGGDAEGAAPGLVLLADTPEGRYLSAAGVSSLEEMTPMQADDILEVGSNTKSMTIVLLMQLQEEGVLSMDDMLSDWLPELAAQIPNGDQITLHQMAQHTAGLWDYGDDIIGGGTTDPDLLVKSYTPEEVVQYAIDNGTPDFSPGEEGKWKYSNTGYILLGMIAEKASGQSLGELYQERIFDPLGLETAVLIEGVPQEGEITAQGYWWQEDGEVLNTTNWNASQGWAAGAVAMTAEDLAAYGKALAAGELFQNEDSLVQMLDFDENALYVAGAPYGLGLLDFGNGYWGHEGQTAGFQTLWYTNPDEQITVVGLTNSAAYPGYAFLNVLNILKGEGAKPFTVGTLLPVGNLVSSKWAWVQLVEPSGTSDIAPGTVLTLAKDGTAIAKGEGCGTAIGPFTSDASSQISFELDTSLLTCDDQAPVTQLVDLLGSAGTWHFDNGSLVIELDDGRSLLFAVDKSEG